jgi:hypothetical protein
MRRWTCCLSALALVLSLAAGLPAWAGEVPIPAPATDLDLTAEPNLTAELNLTPVETPQDLGEIDIEKELRENKIRVCEPDEPDPCPPGCTCVFIYNNGTPRCHCG